MRYTIYRITTEGSYEGHINYAAGRLPRGSKKLGTAATPEEAQAFVECEVQKQQSNSAKCTRQLRQGKNYGKM